ncbi:outer membrane protein [Bosea sp. Leaf344]|uniref:outer membrane protein n=1 Tax=Bosea sp. Leaf344 TaxID=1736346 RepID=UPI000701B30A|nr:outer membrane protein [Bosea sp. Leaf344]
MRTHLRRALATLMILGSGAVSAADLPSSKLLPMAPPLPSFFDWTGFYAGLQIGHSWGQDRTQQFVTAGRVPLRADSIHDHSADSLVGGGHLGFNYQMGALVLGVEGDLEASNASGGFDDPGGRPGPVVDPGGIVRVKQDWQGSVRARLGYAFDRLMVYGSGGVSFSRFEYSYFNPLPAVNAGEGGKFSRTGWTVGAGANYAMSDTIILGLDYRYTDYGRFDYTARGAFLGLTAEHNPRTHALRASVAYKF